MNLFLSLSVLVLACTGLYIQDQAAVTAPEAPLLASMVSSDKPSTKEESSETIPWSARRIVGWSDFQGAPVTGTEAVASTSTTLGLSYQLRNGELSFEINCTFSKPHSWGSLKTEYILAHEQGHFDITEICARKLHQALQDYTFNRRTYKTDLTKIYQQIVDLKENMQETYDQETDHSRRKKVQAEWEARIDQMLAETQPWAAYP